MTNRQRGGMETDVTKRVVDSITRHRNIYLSEFADERPGLIPSSRMMLAIHLTGGSFDFQMGMQSCVRALGVTKNMRDDREWGSDREGNDDIAV